MRLWATTILAIDPIDGKLKNWPGDPVPGETRADALTYCVNEGKGYQRVLGEIVGSIKFIKIENELYEINLN